MQRQAGIVAARSVARGGWRRVGRPVAGANRNDFMLLEETLQNIPIEQLAAKNYLRHVCLDKGDDYERNGPDDHVPDRAQPAGDGSAFDPSRRHSEFRAAGAAFHGSGPFAIDDSSDNTTLIFRWPPLACLHAPNKTPHERPIFRELVERNRGIRLK